jgi:hypothetical protein
MRHPPYNLRPNKAVDRSLLVERIHELENAQLIDSKDCAYYGFGGPFLDDFRILTAHFPFMSFHSLEKTAHTYKRQKFHKFSPRINLHHRSVEQFLANDDMESASHLIWWLDYTNLGINELKDITSLANSLGPGDFLRVTVNANVTLNIDHLPDALRNVAQQTVITDMTAAFKTNYEAYLPGGLNPEEILDDTLFPNLCVRMIEQALEKRNNLISTRIWHLGSRVYRDGVQMVTCEFYVSNKIIEKNPIGRKYLTKCLSLPSQPETINVPNLSIKERLYLETITPRNPAKTGRLSRRLGYHIDNGGTSHALAMGQYAKYHMHYPMLGKVSQ